MILKPQDFYKPSKTARPSDWGHGVTICIAGSIERKTIITVSDLKISLGDFASDLAAEKMDFIHPHWTAMVSGDDITIAVPMWRRMREKLGYIEGQKTEVGEKNVSEVVGACVSAYREHRREIISAMFYAPHGLSEGQFLSEGKKLLGLSLFTEVWNKVDQFKLGCSFLVSGFDKDKQAHIFEVDDPGIYKDYGTIGFWAIGSGQNEALSSIFFTLANISHFPQSQEGMLYDLCAAKFMAESNPYVGKATNLVVRRFGERPEWYGHKSTEAIRKLWKHGRPQRPKRTEGVIKSLQKGVVVVNL
jgi:hypothetical protein